MSWWMIIACAILAALLAIPQLNGFLFVVSLGLLWPVMKTFGMVALAAPAAFALTAIVIWLVRRGQATGIIRSHVSGACMLCLNLLMIHTGASYGFSRMGDGLASMGGASPSWRTRCAHWPCVQRRPRSRPRNSSMHPWKVRAAARPAIFPAIPPLPPG